MKSLIIILLFSLLTFYSRSQGRFIKTTTPCNNELLLKTPGRWMPIGRFAWYKISKPEEQEILKRLDIIQKMAFTVYPEPMAFDAVQGYALQKKDFAAQLKLEKTAYRINREDVNGISTFSYEYSVKFCTYACGGNSFEIMKGAGCEAGTNVIITTNSMDPLFFPLHHDDSYAEIMRIEGRPIKMLGVLREKKWKGYDLYSPESGSGINMVLIHREGVLPYIPATRKQYLDRCIESLQIILNKNIIPFEKREGLQLLMTKEEWDAQTKKMEKFRDDVLKYYRDELEATTRAGLLDSPAIVTGFIDMLPTQPIFTTQAKGGNMVVTENPVYFKKDIPKYIPQLMVYSMWDAADGPDPSLNPYKLNFENFPIQKLQAMIDK